MKATCGKYNFETVQTTFWSALSIVKICVTVSYTHLKFSGLEVIQSVLPMETSSFEHTFNFITEWIRNKFTMSYYRENAHILQFPSKTDLADLSVVQKL